MNFKSAHKPLWRRRYEAFLADRKGATAVEFAVIAFPFFLLIFGLIEITMIFVMSTTLDYGVAEAARTIRTGQAQKSSMSAEDFKQMVCGNLFGLMDCGDKLKIDVRVFATFTGSQDDLPVDENGDLEDNLTFAIGNPNDIVMVRVFYEWDLFTPVMSSSLVNLGNDKRLLASTSLFRNEPF